MTNPFNANDFNRPQSVTDYYDVAEYGGAAYDNSDFYFRLSLATQERVMYVIQKYFETYVLANSRYPYNPTEPTKYDSKIKQIALEENFNEAVLPAIIIGRGAITPIPISIGDKMKEVEVGDKLYYSYAGECMIPISIYIKSGAKGASENIADVLSVGLLHPIKLALMKTNIIAEPTFTVNPATKTDNPASGTMSYIYEVKVDQKYVSSWVQLYSREPWEVDFINFQPINPSSSL